MNQVDSSQLSVEDQSENLVELQGQMNLKNLDFSGNGRLIMHWLDSASLHIRARGQGHINLAGVAQLVDAQVAAGSQLDMRYLRAHEVYVKGFQQADVHVWPENALFAMASGHANIYYYHQPDFIAPIMHDKGSVLAMNQEKPALLHFQPMLKSFNH
jgi:hypothetical protein